MNTHVRQRSALSTYVIIVRLVASLSARQLIKFQGIRNDRKRKETRGVTIILFLYPLISDTNIPGLGTVHMYHRPNGRGPHSLISSVSRL